MLQTTPNKFLYNLENNDGELFLNTISVGQLFYIQYSKYNDKQCVQQLFLQPVSPLLQCMC